MLCRRKITGMLIGILILMISGANTKCQEHPLRAGDDFPLAGLGNAAFFRPAAVFGNPAFLTSDSLSVAVEISADRWSDLQPTKRTTLNGVCALPQAGSLGYRMARFGDESFRITELGAAYGFRISDKPDAGHQWSMGAAVQYQRIRWPPGSHSAGWQGALAVNFRQKQNLWVLRLAYASMEDYSAGTVATSGGQWDWRIGCRRLWSGQLSTDLLAVFNSLNEHRLQLGIHYQILPHLFARWVVQSRPALIGWEQGYHLKFGWLTAHCIRYPAIGWKTGIGILISRPGKPDGHE